MNVQHQIHIKPTIFAIPADTIGYLATVADYGEDSPIGRGTSEQSASVDLVEQLSESADPALGEALIALFDQEIEEAKNLYGVAYLQGLARAKQIIAGSLS